MISLRSMATWELSRNDRSRNDRSYSYPDMLSTLATLRGDHPRRRSTEQLCRIQTATEVWIATKPWRSL